jgi:diguanylate cyclase (GGDEF)-like protein
VTAETRSAAGRAPIERWHYFFIAIFGIAAVFLPERTAEQSRPVAERIRSGVEAIRVQPGTAASARPIRFTLSIGIASHPESGGGHIEILKAADEALYEAKRIGKNRVAKAS